MRLFHFTSLLNLPGILKDGITRGEVPVSPHVPYEKRPKAANLTSKGDWTQQVWGPQSGPTDKLKIRLTIEIDESDVTTFDQAAETYKISAEWCRRLGSEKHRKTWFYAFGGVRPDQIVKVEKLEYGNYRALSGKQVNQLVAEIEKERDEKLTVLAEDCGQVISSLKFSHERSWLIDGRDSDYFE